MSDHPKRRASDNRVRKPRAKPSATVAEKKSLVVPDNPVASMMNFIAEAMTNKDMDVQKLQALLGMQKDLLKEEAQAEFTRAMFRLQAKLQPMVRRGVISLGQGKGSYKFLKREDLDAVLRPLMEAEGFAISFSSHPGERGVTVVAELQHTSGHTRTAEVTLPPDATQGSRNALQALGSTLTYAQRYLTEMLFNIVRTDDDDGKLGGTQFFTPEQVAEIERLIAETSTDRESFLRRFFEATDVGNLTAEQYVPCRNMLLARQRARQPGE